MRFKEGQPVWWRGDKRVLRCTVEEYLGGVSYFVRIADDEQRDCAGERYYSKASSLAPYTPDADPPPLRQL